MTGEAGDRWRWVWQLAGKVLRISGSEGYTRTKMKTHVTELNTRITKYKKKM